MNKENSIKKAVIPVAGKGTRMMPMTLYQPKGMIPVFDKPMFQYPLEELKDAGIKHIIIITSPNQPQFKKYINYLKSFPEWKSIRFDFVVQLRPLGSADALLKAEKLLKQEPFVIHFSDNLIFMKPTMTERLLETFKKLKTMIVPLERVPKSLITHYATTRFVKAQNGFYQIKDIIEKPKPNEIMSLYSVMPSNILTPEIFPWIRKAKQLFKGRREIAIADVLTLYCRAGNPLFGWKFNDTVFNTGFKSGLMKAQVYIAINHPELQKEIKPFVKQLITRK